MGIKIPFLADVANFLAGTKDIEQALDDVADSLDDLDRADTDTIERGLRDVADAADTTGTAVEDLGTTLGDLNRADTTGVESELKEIGNAADTAAEKVEQSFSSAFKSLKADGKIATNSAKADLDSVSKHGSSAAAEFKQEAKQNVAESLSSFQGDATSAVDAIQSTFGGLASALGPAGIVGVSIAAAGIGMARGLFAKSKEEAENLKELVGTIFDELRQNAGVLGDAFQGDQIADLLRDAEAFEQKFGTDIPTAMRTFGADFSTIMQGLTGDSQDVADAQTAVNDAVAAAEVQYGTYVDDLGNVRLVNAALEQTFGSVSLALKDQGVAVGLGVTATQAYSEATKGLTTETEKTATATKHSAEALVSENEQLRIAADLKGDAVLNELDMLDALDGVTAARKRNNKSLSENTAAGRDNLRAIKNAMDGIKDYGDSLVDTGTKSGAATKKMEQQEKVLVDKVAKAFGISDKAAQGYIETLGGIPPAKNTKVTVDDHGSAKAVQDRIDNIRSSGVPVPINPQLPSKAALQRQINAYYNGLSIKVPVALDRYRSGKPANP